MTLVIGHRGAPWEAPENTLSSLRRALELGLDGVEYDLQRTADGEAVLLHDETLERTTSGSGPVRSHGLIELFGLDAGAWFSSSFIGEPIPTFEEAWNLAPPLGSEPLHLVELKDPELLPAVARAIGLGARRRPLILSFHKRVCLAARAMGLDVMFLADVAHEEARRFVRDERLAAFGCGPGGWTAPGAVPDADWLCQRWSWAVDAPAELLACFRRPLFGLNTNEPARALALRELVRRVPAYTGPPPLVVEEPLVDGTGLATEPAASEPLLHPERAVLEPWTAAWCGDWHLAGELTNPFDEPVSVTLEPQARGGAFNFASKALGCSLELAPGATHAFELALVGGSRSPGPDPRLAAHFRLGGRSLTFDQTLTRRREARLADGATRLTMLRESPGEPRATLVVSRRGRELVFRIEDSGGLENPRLVVRLGPELLRGGRHLALQLPTEAFDVARASGLDFSAGFHGQRAGATRIFRFAGGLPPGLFSGAPGRMVLV